MKSEEEIEAAHDLFARMLNEGAPPGFESGEAVVATIADVLCWVLQHEHETAMGNYLSLIGKIQRAHHRRRNSPAVH